MCGILTTGHPLMRCAVGREEPFARSAHPGVHRDLEGNTAAGALAALHRAVARFPSHRNLR